jgi:hypothetical protein
LKYEALVRRVTGKTTNSYGTIENGRPVEQSLMPPANRLRIEEGDGGFLLLRYAVEGAFGGCSWHATLAEAMGQAKFEYEVEGEDWREIPDKA